MHFHMHMPGMPKKEAPAKPKPSKEEDPHVDHRAKVGVGGDACNTICGMHGEIK